MNNSKLDVPVLRWMLNIAGNSKLHIVLLAVVQTVLGVSVIGYAFFLRGLIDGAVAGDVRVFTRYAILLVALVLFLVALRTVKRHVLELARSTMENRFKANLFSHVLRKDYGAVSAVHSAEWMNRLTNDTRVVADGMAQVLPDLCEMLARLVAALVSLLIIEPRFAYILIPGGLLLILLTYVFRTRLKKLHKTIQEKDGDLRVFYQERLNSQMVLRVFGKEDQTEAEQQAFLAAHKAARMKRNAFSNFCNAGFGLTMNGAYVLGAIYCGLGILHGTMTYGTFTAVLQLVGQVQTPFANFSRAFPQYFAMVASAERLMEVEAFEEDDAGLVKGAVDEAENSKTLAAPADQSKAGFDSRECVTTSGSKTFASFKSLGLKDVTFSYEETVPVLEHFSVDVPRGSIIAFTGPSGCGKSTALKLLLGLYKLDAGNGYVELNGVDADQTGTDKPGAYQSSHETLPLSSRTRSLFAYVPQGNDLIRGTIREVVAFGDPDAMQQDDRIWNALTVACGADFVRELEEGLDTLLGEQGTGLSEGQMQRLSIARAVFADRPVLLLDEATSALDAETEAQLLYNLKQLTDKTIIIVTHRPAALEIADSVIEFK